MLARAAAPAGDAELASRRSRQRDHPRVVRALRYREDVRVWRTPDGGGHVLIGRGLAGRWEMAFEVEPSARGVGLGRRLAAAAASLVPAGEAAWAQVSPGHPASLRVGARRRLPPGLRRGAAPAYRPAMIHTGLVPLDVTDPLWIIASSETQPMCG